MTSRNVFRYMFVSLLRCGLLIMPSPHPRPSACCCRRATFAFPVALHPNPHYTSTHELCATRCFHTPISFVIFRIPST